MPPKVRFSREDILAAAFEIARTDGLESVLAREVAKKIGSSVSPIFTAFENMEELVNEVIAQARRTLNSYLNAAVEYSPAFKKLGMQMIKFAIEEPKLFQIVFMREPGEMTDFDTAFKNLTVELDYYLDLIQKDYDLSREDAYVLFSRLWIQSYGISVLCASKICTFTEEEISEMLGEVFAGMVMLIKSDKMKYCGFKPEVTEAGMPVKGVYSKLK